MGVNRQFEKFGIKTNGDGTENMTMQEAGDWGY